MSPYVSTSGSQAVSVGDAVLDGLPEDGGLYVPTRLPTLAWPPPEGVSTAAWAAPQIMPDLDRGLVIEAAERACSFGFPLVELEPGMFVLELFHGPTHAFKDVGARFMATVVGTLARDRDQQVTVLVATSGDTGGAVVSAFSGYPHINVVVLFPRTGVSERQRRQMTTVGGNTHAVAVEGTFDDCQRLVKSGFADPRMKREHGLTSANSINVARLLPQTFYYLDAARRLGEPARYTVPSGNLGNLCAGLIAARMGMPHSGFAAASNANRGFTDFLAGYPFERRSSCSTVSNAMDVGAPSNLERIRWLYGQDDEALRGDVRGGWVSDEETSDTIREVYGRTGYVMDPHTAVAYNVASRHDATDAPKVVLATAHPGKFPDVVERAIGMPVDTPPEIAAAELRVESMSVIAPELAALSRVLAEVSS